MNQKKVKEPTLNPSIFTNEIGGYFKEKGVTLVHLYIFIIIYQ